MFEGYKLKVYTLQIHILLISNYQYFCLKKYLLYVIIV